MRKTNIKITIFLSFFIIIGQVSAFLAYASEINSTNVIGLVNQERRKVGTADLTLNLKLSKIAENKAKDMIKNDYFAHTSPDGKTPWFWFEKEGYEYQFAGENLAINFTTAEKQNESWMKSPSHRKNILSENFKEIGVATVKGVINGKEAIVTVQEFGTRIEAGMVAGESAVTKEESFIENQQVDLEKENFLAGMISRIKSEDYLRIMKGFVIASSFGIILLFFSYFAHKISRVAEILEKMERRFFNAFAELINFHSERHKIVVKFFPMDMMKIRVNHLHHGKQRE
jgi:hypothetical protein